MADNMTCADCGMFIEPADAFHPWMYCWLFKRGVLDPGRFLSNHGFIPDPKRWSSVAAASPVSER